MALTALVACAGAACMPKQPIMVLAPALQAGADVLPVSGRQGFHPWNRDLRFGPFRTVNTSVGWRSDDMFNWSVLDERETWDTKQPLSFTMEASGCARWSARCVGRAWNHHREKAVGLGTKRDGSFGIQREVVEDAAGERFECDLDRPDGARWRVELARLDGSSFGGAVLDERRSAVARLQSTNRQRGVPYSYTVPSPLGFTIETGAGVAGAVERAFDGKVVLSRSLSPERACPLATVAAALLLWEPLR